MEPGKRQITGGRQEIQQERERRNSLYLLISLVPLLILYPVLAEGQGDMIFTFLMTLSLCIGVYIMRGKRHSFLLSCILAIVSLEILWTSSFSGGPLFRSWGEFISALFFIQITLALTNDFIRSTLQVEDLMVTALTLVLSSCTFFGLGYHVLALQSSSSFQSIFPLTQAPSLSSCLFFSITSLIPLGNGSLCAFSPMARIVTGIESIWGYLLLALIVARLTATYIKKERDESITELCQ